MKKILALVIAALMIAAMMTTAMAASITLTRDDTYDNTASGDRVYTYYKVFDADYGTSADDAVSYTLPAGDALVSVLGTWSESTDPKWTKASGNLWFDLTLSADGTTYTVSATSALTETTAQDAAEWLLENGGLTGTPMTYTAGSSSWTTGDIGKGYYIVAGSEGANLVLATTNISMTEKNTYPTIDKKQKKAADSTYIDTKIPVEIGTYIDYKVEVTVPSDANKPMAIIDTMSAGLEYDSTTGLSISPASPVPAAMTAADAEYVDGATWQIKYTAAQVESLQGETIVITYRALVTSAALTDTGRENEVTLKYDDTHYVMTDTVDYTTHFGGIEKVDGTTKTIKLEGVKFNVTVAGTDFNVTPVTKGGDGDDKNDVLYYIPGGDSNEVVTGENGLIIIRGLDGNKTYTLTETETNTGYNLLESPKDLNLVEDTGTAYSTATYDQIENNKGTQLPSTGGIGTTIFYVGGGLLILVAVIFLVTKRRMGSND